MEFYKLVSNSFKNIDYIFWQICIRHVVKIESNFWISDKIINNELLNEHNYCKKFFP
jgi:hypothetical protein